MTRSELWRIADATGQWHESAIADVMAEVDKSGAYSVGAFIRAARAVGWEVDDPTDEDDLYFAAKQAGKHHCDKQGYTDTWPCPECGSTDTGTSTISTSERFIRFGCHECGREFNVRAERVSPLTKHLRRLARGGK